MPYKVTPGVHVGVGLGVPDVAVAVGVGVSVAVAVAVAVGVGVSVAVAVAVAVGVKVAVGEGVGVVIDLLGSGKTYAPRPRVQTERVVEPRSMAMSQIITCGIPFSNRFHNGDATVMSSV